MSLLGPSIAERIVARCVAGKPASTSMLALIARCAIDDSRRQGSACYEFRDGSSIVVEHGYAYVSLDCCRWCLTDEYHDMDCDYHPLWRTDEHRDYY